VGADAVHAILAQCAATRHELSEVWTIVQASDSLQDRLCTAGVLSAHDARAFGAVGFVGRASAQDFDVRRDAPYAPYDALAITVPCLSDGDIAARARIRHDEVLISIALVESLLAALPDGEVSSALRAPRTGAEGIGIVDGWRGEVVTHVRFAAHGRIARFFPRDPSWLSWPTLERLIHGNIVPDFPVCNKSVNGSYSGHDL
jgi:Ni,Fe-hydrogenase III large subunit